MQSSTPSSLRLNTPSVAQTLGTHMRAENRARLSTTSRTMRNTMHVTPRERARGFIGRSFRDVVQLRTTLRRVLATAVGVLGHEIMHDMDDAHLRSLGWTEPDPDDQLTLSVDPRMVKEKYGYMIIMKNSTNVFISSPQGWIISMVKRNWRGPRAYIRRLGNLSELGRLELDGAKMMLQNDFGFEVVDNA